MKIPPHLGSNFKWCFESGYNRTHGWWSLAERSLHINALELKAVFNGLRCFAADFRDCDILLRIDNSTAVAYINKFGSVRFPHLSAIAAEIWQWCEKRNNFVFASYIPSLQNNIADAESRIADPDTEWSLSDKAFRRVWEAFGPFDVNLFASLNNNKCEAYVSWFPDPGSIAIDAFTLSWNNLKFYAFPPFILLPRVFRKIADDQATGTVIVPWWPSQPWFPLFCRLSLSEPLFLLPDFSLLSSPFRNQHPAWRTLSLAAANLSGKPSDIA
ncbi:hypothetical protein ALC57_01197 [Trachymyrmex cornetzi]|uniref:RNase H type-1 domain-containing protein n=1 Tax=Trachymyrmex cornetzi TaxID=471704 RepID=A0A151JQM0_9HYME|nr:hypothetical protein ALC57_01197 [Trachymyrmex cornetzi]